MPTIVISLLNDGAIPVDQMENDDDGKSCPLATQDPDINEENKMAAAEEAAYRDPSEDGGFRSDEVCGNCGAYNQTEDMMDCIGVEEDEDSLGYCQIFKFVCESMHTCDRWIKGGPIKTDLQNQYRGDIL